MPIILNNLHCENMEQMCRASGSKRPRKSSSDSEAGKPPNKMATIGDTSTDDVVPLLRELKQGQQSLRAMLDKKVDTLKNELAKAMDLKVQAIKDELLSEINKIDEKFVELERRMQSMEDCLNEHGADIMPNVQVAGQSGEEWTTRLNKQVK